MAPTAKTKLIFICILTPVVGCGILAPKPTSSVGQSDHYAERVDLAISSSETIRIYVREECKSDWIETSTGEIAPTLNSPVVNVDTQYGGGVTFGNSGTDQVVVVSGNPNYSLVDTEGNPLRDESADILMHELVGHAIPHIVGTETGNAVENENLVRIELNVQSAPEIGPQRAPESGHTE